MAKNLAAANRPIGGGNARRSRRPYDPGQPGRCMHFGGGQFAVESWKRRGEWYDVDLIAGTCTCPAFAKTGAESDKHIKQAREKVVEIRAQLANRKLLEVPTVHGEVVNEPIEAPTAAEIAASVLWSDRIAELEDLFRPEPKPAAPAPFLPVLTPDDDPNNVWGDAR